MILNSADLDILTVRTWNKHPELDGRLVVNKNMYYCYIGFYWSTYPCILHPGAQFLEGAGPAEK